MKIFVAGGTGVIGWRATRALVAAGHAVTVVARDAAKAELVRSLDAHPVTVDLFDPSAVHNAVAGHEAVANLATNIPPMSKAMLPGAWATNDRLRIEASRHLVDAALAGGAQRFVQESICFPYADQGDRWIGEGGALEHTRVTASSADAESAAVSFGADGRVAVVLRFAQFYADDSAHTKAFNTLARAHVNPFVGPPDSYASFIEAADAADAVVAALVVPAGVYNVGDDEPLTRKEAGEAIADALDVKRVRAVPGARRAAPPTARALMRSQRVCNAKLRATGAWSPRHSSIRGSWPVQTGR